MKKRFLKSLPERELARFQSLQKGNDCTLHAISAALELLTGLRLPPYQLVAEVNRLWWRGKLYRVLPNWAVTPPMQASIVNYLARTRGLPVRARLLHTAPEILRNLPDDENLVALVTIYWRRGRAPAIYRGATARNHNQSKSTAGHTMLFAAYDPTHTTGAGISTPWGFINSWCDGGARLYWMKDEDFRRSWGFFLPLVGPNPLVLVRKTV